MQEVFNDIDPLVKNGIELADNLNKFRDSLLTQHSGAARPSYVKTGMIWISNSILSEQNKLILYIFDGTNDVEFARLDVLNHTLAITNAGRVIISEVQPAGVADGQLWFNTSDASINLRVQDQWVDAFRYYLKASDISIDDTELPFDANTLDVALKKTNDRIGLAEGLHEIVNNDDDIEIEGAEIDSESFFAAIVEFGIYRKDDTKDLVATGTLKLHFKSSTNTWTIDNEDFDNDFVQMGLSLKVTTTNEGDNYKAQLAYDSTEFNNATHEGAIGWTFLRKFSRPEEA